MKKFTFIFILLIGILNVTNVNAVSYRGFAEGNIGLSFTYDHTNKLNVGGYTTHGIQFYNVFYVGVGVGYELFGEDYGFQLNDQFSNKSIKISSISRIAFYGDLRWDGFGLFGTGKRVSPFVDIKIGYHTNLKDIHQNYYYSYYSNIYNFNFKAFSCGGMFMKPTIGIRIGCSHKVGINLGIYYDLISNMSLKSNRIIYFNDMTNKWVAVKDYKQNLSLHPFGLSIGVDF